MGRAIRVLCCLIVAAQVVVGVPAVVCLGFFALYGGLGPIAIEVHPGESSAQPVMIHGATIPPPVAALASVPPRNMIPATTAPDPNNPIVATRAELGSPFAGTVMGEGDPTSEQTYLVAACERLAAEAAPAGSPALPPSLTTPPPASAPLAAESPTCPVSTCPVTPCPVPLPTANGDQAETPDQAVVRHLYTIAEIDERAGNYDRADQWRALAREIRSLEKAAEGGAAPAEAPTSLPSFPLDSP